MSIQNEIHIKGAREHNLKNVELRLPRGKLVVLTGVSGSGKSSLAFDTLYAEGYRKYMESLSTRARQMLEQVRRPDVDFIHGLSPVVAIEQREGGSSPRSTVATVTEIADYARLLWALRGEQRCPKDGGAVRRHSLDDCVERLLGEPEGTRLILLAPFLEARPAVLRDEIAGLRHRGFQRIRIAGEIRSLDEPKLVPSGRDPIAVELVIDRIVIKPDQRGRLADSLELAFREGGDRALALVQPKSGGAFREIPLNRRLACEICGDRFEPLTSRHFSFNHTEGLCPECGGMGRRMSFSDELVVPDPSKSVKEGAIKPWRLGGKSLIIRNNAILKQLAEQLPFDPLVPWKDLPEAVRTTILHGAGERRFVFKLRRSKKKNPDPTPFAGVIPMLEKSRRETKSDGFRARLGACMVAGECPICHGGRLNPASAAVRLEGVSLPEFYALSLEDAAARVETFAAIARESRALEEVVTGLRLRLEFLGRVGLDYLTLNREYATLSGGEAQRVRLATQLGMGLVGVVYILDEPSIGLHPVDNERLLASLIELRDRGNTVLVVEHDEETLRRADHLVEIGPGAGREGGEILYEGPPEGCYRHAGSRAGPYLSGEWHVLREAARKAPEDRWLTVRQARENNLQGVDAGFPVGLFTCVTGVSGSGKSSLVNDVLARAAAFRLNRAKSIPGKHAGVEGWEHFESMVEVDAAPIGRTPRSNPATYVKLFDLLRAVFAQCPLSRVRGYGPGRFSFNVRGGRCERCQGDGVIKLNMEFLADAEAVCPSCHGRRYNRETLEVRFKGHNIADVLALTVGEAMEVFGNHPRIMQKLDTLEAVGLGYLQLGQPATTLSGGEAQRIKLSLELSRRSQGRTLYILDEPTTGLHWADVQKLMDLLFRLRDAGNTIIVIEHNQDVQSLADWIIDLGPGGGTRGGRIVYSGPPEKMVGVSESRTGEALARRQQEAFKRKEHVGNR